MAQRCHEPAEPTRQLTAKSEETSPVEGEEELSGRVVL